MLLLLLLLIYIYVLSISFRPTFAALIMQALAIYFTYGLQCYMPITILKYGYAIPAIEDGTCKGTPFLWDLIIRFGITVVTCKRQFLFIFPFALSYLQCKLDQIQWTAVDCISLCAGATNLAESINPFMITVRFSGPRYY